MSLKHRILNLKILHKKGFTLAEVLITITIIGVVAALTIPNLIQSIQNQQYISAWKKSYSILNQASLQILSEKKGSYNNICGYFDSNCFRDLFKPYLKYVKECSGAASYGNCWVHTGYLLNGVSVTDTGWDAINSRSSLILNDGTLILFQYQFNNGSGNPLRYGHIFVDINGFNPPNIVGKDIYGVVIYDSNLLPISTVATTYTSPGGIPNTCSTNGTGWGCSEKYLLQ